MENYLNSENNIRMYKRILHLSEDIESAENIIKIFFDFVIPFINKNINEPYTLYKDLKYRLEDDLLRYIIFEEIGLYYIQDESPYSLFEDKTHLDYFLDFINEEQLILSDKLGLFYDRRDILGLALSEIKSGMEYCSTLAEKKDFLHKEKIEARIGQYFDLVNEIDNLIEIVNAQIENQTVYIDITRIEDLRSLTNPKCDVLKVIKLCEEINKAYANKSYISIPVLLRALIDHIPPVFDEPHFEGVIARHGTKSFKESMSHLDKSLRKIADSIMHSHIRNKEILPSHVQIDFRADLDILLSEIILNLKK